MPSHEERISKSGLQLPRGREALRLFGRALTLRCPHCGGGPVLQHWLKLRVRCGTCGLRLQRGEHDYFVGAMVTLFAMVGVLMLTALAVTLLATAPNVPWDLLQDGLPALALVAIFALFPFAKLAWLAFDLMLRPVNPDELAWHRAEGHEGADR